jgi:WD40 repeat protein
MGHHVFICYSNQDKSTADAVSVTLESQGIPCWIAPRDILPGISWGEAIIDAITDARLLILILSSHSNRSQQVMREVERAASKGVLILPFRIENTSLSKSLEYFISGSQWLEASPPPIEPHLGKLWETVKSLLFQTEKQEGGNISAKNSPVFAEMQILTRHSPSVSSLAWSPDGNFCATGGADGKVLLWNTQTWKMISEIKRDGRVQSLVFAPRGKQLLVLQTNSREVWFWGIERGLEFSLDNGSSANSAAFSPDATSLAVGSRDHTTKLWNLESESLTDTLEHPYRVQSVAYSPDGRILAVAGGYEEVRLWNLQKREKTLAETDTSSNNAHKLLFSPDGTTILTLRAEMKVMEVCDTQTGRLEKSFRCPSKLQTAAFSPTGEILAAGAWDAKIYLWDVPTGKLLNSLDGHTNIVTTLAFSPKGEYLLSGSWDSTVRVWTVRT